MDQSVLRLLLFIRHPSAFILSHCYDVCMTLQDLCDQGQQQLQRMEYLRAEESLMAAEQLAFEQSDWDTISRLYMPLQEARRQRRQRCGEGTVCLDFISSGPGEDLQAEKIIEKYPHGQLLIAGWGTIEPAKAVRQLARQKGVYVEAFLAAAYPTGGGRAIAIIPVEDIKLPEPTDRSIDALIRLLPAHSIVLSESELPKGPMKGDTNTFARVMSMWERLHAPFLAAADMQVDPIKKIEGYRKTIRVDYACELAHQKLSDVARSL